MKQLAQSWLMLALLFCSPSLFAHCDAQHDFCVSINRLNVEDDVVLLGDISFHGTLWGNVDLDITYRQQQLDQASNIQLPASLFNLMFNPSNITIQLEAINGHKVYRCKVHQTGDLEPGNYTMNLKRYWLFGDHYSCRIQKD